MEYRITVDVYKMATASHKPKTPYDLMMERLYDELWEEFKTYLQASQPLRTEHNNDEDDTTN